MMNVMDLACWWLSTTVPTQGFVFQHGQVGSPGLTSGEVGSLQPATGQVNSPGMTVGETA